MCSCFCNERYLVCLKYFGMIFSLNSFGLWIRNALPLGSHDTISASLSTVLSNKACNLKGNAWWFTAILPSFERVEAGQSDYQKKKNMNFMKLWMVKNTGFRQNRKFLRDFLGDYLHGKLLKYRRPLLATSCVTWFLTNHIISPLLRRTQDLDLHIQQPQYFCSRNFPDKY